MKITVLLLVCVAYEVSGHGRLWEPPSRSSMWRKGFDNPANYNDNELFCGGFGYQQQLGGKCGVCGDPYDKVRENEAGGKYANGIISRVYQPGEIMTVEVDITANHYGWFEFRMCVNNNPSRPVTQACLDANLLNLADGSGTRYKLPSSSTGIYKVNLRLPTGVTCSQCVLQWKYHTGNSWGTDPDTGRGCVGCGPQEQFYGCSDIAIEGEGATATVTAATTGPTPTNVPSTEPTPSAWPTEIPNTECKGTGSWAGNPTFDRWCTKNCLHFPPFCPATCTCFRITPSP